ncbi:MAG: YndJ family transporter [Myxococcota bacterium]
MLTATTIAGLAAWAAWAVGLASGAWMGTRVYPAIEWLTLLGPLAVVPLGLPLLRARGLPDAEGDEPVDAEVRAWRRVEVALPVGVLLALASMVVEKGAIAGALGGGWAVVTWLVARRGWARLRRRTPPGLAERCADAASLYLLGGGVMWAVARSGAWPFGLAEPVVTLAATHFHLAAFALLAATAEVGRALGATHGAARGPTRTAWVVAAWLAMIAPALVAIGITAWPPLETGAAVLLSAAGLVLGLLMATAVAPRVARLWPAALIAMGGLALAVGTAAAALFALGRVVPPAAMVPLHGVANGVFFGLGGLAGLRLARSRRGGKGTSPLRAPSASR